MQINPCPFDACSGAVFVRSFGGLKAFGCDGPDQHTDGQIRNALLGEVADWTEETEAELDKIERRIDPVAWLLGRVYAAQQAKEVSITDEDLANFVQLPPYATGLSGSESGGLIQLRGMTTCSGKASSGKTWFALGAAINSAIDGWNVHYIAAEGEDVIKRRVHHACGGNPPKSFHLHAVEPGVTADDILERVGEWITSTRTLLVLDSISTLMSFMAVDHRESRWDAQGRLETFLMGLRKLTRGEVSIIVISESNAAGESKGRTIDHRSDISINFKSMEDSDAKEIRVVKAWESSTGLIGRAMVDPNGPGLDLIYDGPKAYASNDTREDM